MGLAPGVAAWLMVPVGAGHGLGLLPGAWAVPVTLAVDVINAADHPIRPQRRRLRPLLRPLAQLGGHVSWACPAGRRRSPAVTPRNACL